jgi:hypothetical protein
MPNFHFQASAVGVAGKLRDPYHELIPAHATAALPDIGGVAYAHVSHFRQRFVSFRDARSEIIGSEKSNGELHSTLIQATVEGLNIMDMVTADRIVARLVSKHGRGEPSITPVGSYFENLRIAGERVRVNLATDTFDRLGTFTSLANAAAEKEEDVCALLDVLDGKPFGGDKRIVSGTLAPRVSLRRCGVTTERNVVTVPGFGTVRLAQIHISEYWRRVTMVVVEMGSPPDGQVSAAGVQGDGTDW